MSDSLKALAEQIAELQQKFEAEKARVRTDALEGIKQLLDLGTITHADLRGLLPKANPGRKRGPKPKNPQEAT